MDPDVVAKLVPIFHDVFEDETITLRADTTAADIDGWDSFAHVRLVVAVEQAFKVRFSAKEVNDLKNVGEFVQLIRSKSQ